MTNINVDTYNVRGLANNMKRREIFHYLHQKPFNVVFMQETHSCKKIEKRWRLESGDQIYFSHGETNARGVAILIRRSLKVKILRKITNKRGRFFILKCKIDSEEYLFVNVYAPDLDNPAFFTELSEQIDSLETDLKIIGGDFNLVLDLDLDKKGGMPVTNEKAAEVLKAYKGQNGPVDTWREMRPDVRG